MALLNALSVPRGLATFPRKWLKAHCQPADSVGDCVYVTGNKVGAFYQVTKADPRNQSKMPAVGIISSKKSSTECRVQFLGEIEGIYTGLNVRKTLFVSEAGRLAEVPPVPTLGGYAFVQVLGSVVDEEILVLVPNYSMVKRVG